MKVRTIFCLVIGALSCASTATAGLVDVFEFNETDGTVITGAANTGTPGGHSWLSENTTVQSAMNGGAFRIQKASPTSQIGNTFDIADITSGSIWLVAEFRGWSYTATPSSTSERVRFAFLDNATPSAGSNTITAEINLDRSGSNLTVTGDAGGTGATSTLPGGGTFALTRSIPLTFALEVNADADTYSIFYKDDTNPYTAVGTGNLGERSAGVKREARSVRFAFTGLYNDTGEFVDVERIYVTDINPTVAIPEPGAFLLVGAVAVGVWRARRYFSN
jgi:hypothetical protein